MKEKIALFCDVDEEAVITAQDVDIGLRSAAGVRARRAGRAWSCGCCSWRRGPRDLSRWTAMLERMHNPQDEVRIGLVGKYVEVRGFLQEPEGSAAARRAGAQGCERDIDWIEAEGLDSAATAAKQLGARTTASWCRADSASAASRACSTPFATRARTRCRTSAFAWACRRWRSSTRATCAGWQTPTPPSSIRSTPHRVIYKLRELKGVDELGGTMRLGAWPCQPGAGFAGGAGLRHARKSASATATATNSTANTRELLTARACASPGETPDGTYVEIVRGRRAIRGSSAASSIRSSSRSRWSRIRCSRRSSARRCVIAKARTLMAAGCKHSPHPPAAWRAASRRTRGQG